MSTKHTCFRCFAVSHNPNDARERYCWRCHAELNLQTKGSARTMVDARKHAEEVALVKDALGAFMARSEIKLVMSLLPPARSELERDVLTSLLEAAIVAGVGLGRTMSSQELMEAMRKSIVKEGS